VDTITSVGALRERLQREPDNVFVPTMGNLHAGHIQLMRMAKQRAAACTVVSIFVNRIQFGPKEDYDRYPRTLESDAKMMSEVGVDVVFAPSEREIYPGPQTFLVEPSDLQHILEGAFRPGHFRGVATICLKLFNIIRPQVAYFGQKDAQQAAVLRTMLRDLNLDRDLELRVLPTVRDADGLALSSRNAYLSAEEREQALALPQALATGSVADARTRLAESGLTVDYVDTIEHGEHRILTAAVRVGGTRLIDNVILEGETP
jgi:pantoate--beta-alanine ligase